MEKTPLLRPFNYKAMDFIKEFATKQGDIMRLITSISSIKIAMLYKHPLLRMTLKKALENKECGTHAVF